MSDQLSLAPDAPVKASNKRIALRRLHIEDVAGADRDLVESIKVHGVLEPIVVEPEGDGYLVIDGRRRAVAANAAGLRQIPARVVEIDGWLGREVLGIMLNEQRGPNAVSELKAIERLVDNGKTESEIAKATGMDVGTIRKRLRLIHLLPELRDAWERGEIKTSVAEGLARLHPGNQAGLLGVLMESGKLTSADVRDVRYVGRKTASADLPAELFEVPAVPPDWKPRVRELLIQARAAIPEDAEPYPNWLLGFLDQAMDAINAEDAA